MAYYNTASASIGFQLGAQVKSQIIMFMDGEALDKFRSSDGWEAGVDGSVAIVEFGAAEEISSNSAQQPSKAWALLKFLAPSLFLSPAPCPTPFQLPPFSQPA